MKQTVDEWKTKLDKTLHEKNKFTNLLEKVEVKSGVKRLSIVLGAIVVLGLYLMVGYVQTFCATSSDLSTRLTHR